ncbi:ABC transporter ATP-binding protein [Priestia koreensis]|uniref:ABC transporter ATP-binding protein n=1 Tax=Priestia koreensis TaxID=284581 RepID=UPI001F574141|nr:ABC transporter transmembrane domain-containing protein [Priestia koreensis]MCM3004723.1 ABC transporter transmembrane domain-containing protein [Priestia koreensis]UNL85529.1 ATP-binding cassette domain-containing protein [Priestia koreensis]
MFSVLKKLGWFFRQHWKRYVVAIILLIIAGVVDVIPPKFIGMAIDEIQAGSLSDGTLWRYMSILGALAAVSYIITYVWMYQLFGGSFLVERLLRKRFMKHLLKMTPTFYEKNRTGDLMARATNDLKAISTTAGFGIMTMVDSSAFMLTILFTMGFLISWKLTFAALLPLPIMALMMNIFGKRIHERFTVAQDAFGVMNDKVLESVSGVRVIRAYVQEEADEHRFDQLTEDIYKKNMEVAKIDALFEPTIKILVGMSYLIGLGYGAYLVFHSEITLGELVSFNVYLGMMIWPMFAIGELINVMQRGNASLDRVNETLSYKADVENATSLAAISEPGVLQFNDVTFQYPSSSIPNLKQLTFTLNKGQTIGIVGKTGSGKTTIIKQLLRQYPLGEGEISISNVDMRKIAIEDIQGWIGYVPQDHILFSKTVRENIAFANKEASAEEVDKAIDLAAFRQDIEHLQDGLNTLVGEKGVALSGGQKQRISIARALLANPEILILDDALSAVDAKTESAIIENIRAEREGKTTFIVTHRLSAVEHADVILVMDEGEVIERGNHQELVKKGGWYAEQYDRQQLRGIEPESGVIA